MSLFWAVGFGKGNDKLTALTMEPKLVSISPNVGSVGGTFLTLNVQGVGTSTQGL